MGRREWVDGKAEGDGAAESYSCTSQAAAEPDNAANGPLSPPLPD